jgi:hypothetical protein
VTVAAPRREPPGRRAIVASRNRAIVLRRGFAALLVALLAALTPVLSAPAADAARLIARTTPAATSPASATAPGSSTGHAGRRGLRAVAQRTGARVTQPPADGGELRQAQPQQGGTAHQRTGPDTGSIDATGPPAAYGATAVRPSTLRLGGCHYPAAAGRAPPISCGS